MLKQLTKALLERAMQPEMTDHLGYEKHDPVGNNSGNSRNGATIKTLKGDFGEMPLETPRDRNGSYEPKITRLGRDVAVNASKEEFSERFEREAQAI